jgi:hypothetical protein
VQVMYRTLYECNSQLNFTAYIALQRPSNNREEVKYILEVFGSMIVVMI